MKISIVTLSYNQQAFLREAVDSVLQQVGADVEYIVVDPGSKDGSRDVLQSYDGKISELIFEPDNGAADGLNKGFARATGEIFGFLNADDYLLPGALRQIAKFFLAHPECDMVMGNGFVVDAKGQELRHIKARNFSVQSYLYGGTRWMQQSTFFRREIYGRTTGFNTENRTCWDGELFVSMLQMGAVVGYIDSDLAAFRLHSASISGSKRLQVAFEKDCKRIFHDIRGRDWSLTDELLRLCYRIQALLVRSGLWPETIAQKKDLA